jgi:hypothetical protein
MSRLQKDSTHHADNVRSRLDDARSQLRRGNSRLDDVRGFASDPGLADETRGFASDPGLADETRGFASDPGLADETRGFASGPSVLGGFASPDPIDRKRDFGSSAPSDPR